MAPRRPMLLGMVQRLPPMTSRQRPRRRICRNSVGQTSGRAESDHGAFPVTLGGRVLSVIEKAVNLDFNTLANHW
jgi:hypothetical protein